MNSKTPALILLLITMLSACTDDEDFTTVTPVVLNLHAEDFGEEVLITTKRDITGSRSAISTGENNTLTVRWTTTDSIRLYAGGHKYTYLPKIQADSSTIVFVSADSTRIRKDEADRIYAVLCNNLASITVDNGILSSEINMGNTRNLKPYRTKWAYMYATGNVSKGKLQLNFRHVFSYARIIVPVSRLQNYTSIALYSPNTKFIPSKLEYDMDKGEFTGKCLTGGYNVAYSIIDSVQATDNTKEFYIPMFPSDGYNAYSVKGATLVPGTTSQAMTDLYQCDEPENGLRAGEVLTINTQAGYLISTNYSDDGKVKVLEAAKAGNGISLVFMGQGFTDKEIRNGKYENTMRREMERFFSIEPYKSHRKFFTSYMVTRVAKTNDMSKYETVNEEEDWNEALYYTGKAITFQRADTTFRAIVVYNGNYTGRSVTIFTYTGHYVSFIMENNPTVVCHEAGGHGFGLLADEYVEAANKNKRLPSQEKLVIKYAHEKYGAFANIDTYAKAPVWSKFITDSRYASERIGAYQGAHTYPLGVYRPTENSIMNDHTRSNAFNAPSREAIYRNIRKHASYGYIYHDTDFFSYDVINLGASYSARNRAINGNTGNSSVQTNHILSGARLPILRIK